MNEFDSKQANDQAFLVALVVKNQKTKNKKPTCQRRRPKRFRFDPWVRKIPWKRAWQPTPVFLPGESHGQRSLTGYSPWGCKELDTTAVTQHARTLLVGMKTYTITLENIYPKPKRKEDVRYTKDTYMEPNFSFIPSKSKQQSAGDQVSRPWYILQRKAT